MKHGKQARQWLVAAVTLATLGVTQGFAADAPTTVSEQHMPYNEAAISTTVTPGAKDSLAEQGLIDNPALTVGQTTQTSNVQALYVAKADQAAIDAQVGKTVTNVALAGVPDGVAQQVLPRLTTKVGDKVSSEAIAADIKAIGDSGIFAQIAPVFTAVPEGVQLTYQVATNPVVNQVRVEGVSAFDAEYLAQMLAIPQGSVLNTVEVGEKVRAIEDLYVKQGYILASVSDVQVAPDGTLTVKVDEGIVEDIVIKGNKKTKDYVITRELRFKEGDPFNKYLAQRSLERLYNLGYFEDVNVRLLPGKVDHQV
ncbi:MAG: POTRA domain-containing protein, partial [Negativicoccus succinicivorans]|uniref:POTRA domain-containing protein n=1 Tax=Negativicoccus succinicivorans TaxID=620903 RepID=UPI002910A9D9